MDFEFQTYNVRVHDVVSSLKSIEGHEPHRHSQRLSDRTFLMEKPDRGNIDEYLGESREVDPCL